jgi:VWFA-related protein
MKPSARAAALLLAVVAGGPALAQTRQAPVFRAGVETVQIDVVVRDREGNPIYGLTADDFVILDRGRPQPIVAFKAVRREDHETPASTSARRRPITTRLDVSSNQTANASRLVVLVLDDLHGFRGRDEVVKKIARGLVGQLGSDALLALLMTSGHYNVEVTEDRSRIMAAIDQYKGARAVRRPTQAIDDRRGGTDLQEFDANLNMYATLEQAARLFSGTDGRRKAFVLISENLVKDLGGVLQSQMEQPALPQGGEAYASGNLEMMPRMVPSFHEQAALAATKSMRQSNVITYAIDPRGAVSAQDVMLECHPAKGLGPDPCVGDETSTGPASMSSWVRVAQKGLQQLADASGGFAIVNSSDFDAGIAKITDDLDNYYLLGFNPDDTRTQGFRRLEVQVRNLNNVVLRYRRGYEMGARANEPPPMKDTLFGMVAGALPRSNVPLKLTAAALPGSGRDARIHVAFEVSVPRQTLEDADARLRDQIRYSVTVVDMKGSKVKESSGYGARMVLRPRPGAGEAPSIATYQIGLELKLPPGRYHLRASASSTRLEDGGSVYLPLDVPDYTSERIAVSALVIGYGSGPRVPATVGVSPAQALGRARTGIPPPARGPDAAVPAGLPFTPTLDREFLLGDDVVLYFEVARKDRAREIALNLMAVDPNEHVYRQFGQKLPAGSAGKVTVRLPLKEIGPGAFRLRVLASDGVNEAMSEVPIVIK